MRLTCIAEAVDDGRRAVDVLCRQAGISHLLGKKIRLYGDLQVNGIHHRMIDPVHSGDRLAAEYSAPDEMPSGARCEPAAGIEIRYEDDWLVVADKPPHLLTHPAYDGQTDSLITALTSHRLHPVSRLDRNTSGLVVLAKNGHSHHVISHSSMVKRYLGITFGCWYPSDGTVDRPIARAPGSIVLRQTDPTGSPAVTRYRTLAVWRRGDLAFSRMVFELETGRTHQIRVHCLSAGCPLVGDGLYGLEQAPAGLQQAYAALTAPLSEQIDRQSLHAAYLAFRHPVTREPLVFESAVRPDIRRLAAWLDAWSGPASF